MDNAVVGHTNVKNGICLALIAKQHVYIEGPPGSAKTLLAETTANETNSKIFFTQLHRDTRINDLLGDEILIRETFIAVSIPSNGHVTYDQFERCVLAASGGIQPEPDIILDNLSSSSSSDDGQNTKAGRSSSSASDDERSYSDSGRASNTRVHATHDG